MDRPVFSTPDGTRVPAVTAAEMAEVDRVAVEDVGLTLLQMMENAGRTLAIHARRLRTDGPVVILAGGGGNGGGGLVGARHLANRAVPVTVVLDRDPSKLDGATATQYGILDAADVPVTTDSSSLDAAGLVVDALIGYGLRDAPRDRPAELLERLSTRTGPVLSLDVPSGVDATTGATPGVAVRPDATLTLALPKTGLVEVPGDLYLADIGLPAAVFRGLDLAYDPPFTSDEWVALLR